ncbi:uncharacterized protein IL334_005951 [Kwoniella shivajii]|uniref:Mediator of RNA polymerase II transcription subunit 5 n=1 Tax=Kwoniella shivajii TaxID=564305 RepID=A0ABZ1D643_9TREE|nr:hypothetical protein IL334_005951 [Kwoniella shivajii]
MVYEDLSLPELVSRAYARAVPPKKFVKLIQKRVVDSPDRQGTENAVASAILPHLLPYPPALILSYLSKLLESPILTSRTTLIHLLFRLSDLDQPNISSLTSISNILLTHSTGLEDSIPSILSSPNPTSTSSTSIPDVGTSASANASTSSPPSNNNQISTLALLLPLLRICSTYPSSSITTLVSKIVSVLAPFPAPSLDVGLEAGQLLPSLPEEIGGPLRNTLSGLMADLATQDIIQDVQMNDVDNNTDSQQIYHRLPLRSALTLLIEWAQRSNSWMSDPNYEEGRGEPKQSWKTILKLASEFTNDATEFVRTLLDIMIQDLTNSSVETMDAAKLWGVLSEDVCGLFKWWKDHSDASLPFPDDIISPLATLYQQLSPSMQTFSEQLEQKYSNLIDQAENQEEGSGFTPLDGWSLYSLQETLISRLIQLNLINHEQAGVIAPGVTAYTFTPGESLINRLSSETHSHLPPLVHTIQYSFSASSAFASELIQTIKSCPVVQPPENLFNFVASQSGLLAVLEHHILPLTLLRIMERQLLDLGVDEASRGDDPQGSLTRFGEGVALVEAFVAHYKLPLPPLLEDARCAISFSSLSMDDKECMNGWVKAIFGSDGIEDAILLATPPQKLYKLAPTLIQQAIAAVAAAQIDLDTLHSGLSYFSQPLLSWCLGGVVGWLCREIRRQGLLSALHLVVLQDLILGHSCPEALVRVNATSLNDLLSPASGLTQVIASSNFDFSSIRNKLDSSGLHAPLTVVETPLRSALQLVRQVELAPPRWEKTIFDSLEMSLSWQGDSESINCIMDEINLPQVSPVDNLNGVISLILSLKLGKNRNPLIDVLIDLWLPSKFNSSSGSTPSSPLIPIIKRSLIVHSTIRTDTSHNGVNGNEIISNLIDEVETQLSKPVDNDENGIGNANVSKKNKKRFGEGQKLSVHQREFLENLVRNFRDDEELRSRFDLSRLDRLL